MAILKCQHCEYSKEISEPYTEKMLKCPSCGQSAKIYDAVALLTAFSEQMSAFQAELNELKQSVTQQPPLPTQINEELMQALGKVFREQLITTTEFNDAIKRRTSLLARLGMAGFFIQLVILIFFVFQFADNARTVSEQVFTIGDRMKVITDNMDSLKDSLVKLNTNIQATKDQTDIKTLTSIDGIRTSVGTVQSKVKEMNDNIAHLVERMDVITRDNMSSRYRPYR